MFKRLREIVVQSAFAALIAWLLIIAPISAIAPQTWFAFVQVPIVIFGLVCYIGKLLIDTLFYDHYKL